MLFQHFSVWNADTQCVVGMFCLSCFPHHILMCCYPFCFRASILSFAPVPTRSIHNSSDFPTKYLKMWKPRLVLWNRMGIPLVFNYHAHLSQWMSIFVSWLEACDYLSVSEVSIYTHTHTLLFNWRWAIVLPVQSDCVLVVTSQL